MRKKGLKFSSERRTKQRQLRAFILAFAAFVLVLGAVSLLLFLKSVDFDLGNLVERTTEKTPETGEPPVGELLLKGKANILFACGRDGGGLVFLADIYCDMDAPRIFVFSLDVDTPYGGGTLSDYYVKYGMEGLKAAVGELLGVRPDRYIRMSETGLRKFLDRLGDVPVKLSEPFSYRGEDFRLELDAGVQSLSPDMFCRYIKCCGSGRLGGAVTALTGALLQPKNIPSREMLFNLLVNNSSTDISVVDYTKYEDMLSAYVRGAGESAVCELTDAGELRGGEE